MPSRDPLKQSMDVAVEHYSSLFRLPSARKVPLLLMVFCIVAGTLTTLILSPTFEGLARGVFLGVILFSASMAADYTINTFVLRNDSVFDLRRTMALSIFCWAVWLIFILIGAIVYEMSSGLIWWVRLNLLGFSATLILRFTVFYATSSKNHRSLLTASLLQPFLSVVPFLVFWTTLDAQSISFSVVNLLVFFLPAAIIAFATSFVFLYFVNQVGKKTIGFQSVPLFRAFMLNWASNLNAPFEDLLEKMGEQRDVEVSLMKFGHSEAKAVLVIPSVHPGPFKNIGSSLLPAQLKSEVEKKLNCKACVPHGILGHEYDLASQDQNMKVISDVASGLRDLESRNEKASPFVTVTNGLATGCCQIFGKFAFISFTLAPKTIEDLPEELGQFVREEANRRSLNFCAVVNAHNSINGAAEMEESLTSLKDVAVKCFDKALLLEKSTFEVGISSVFPKEFSLEDGMGSGGITALVVKSGSQKAAYIVIDGNNLVSGLRERILSSLRTTGIDEGEIFTTDTHAVTALILTRGGYHPVGEAMEKEKLIEYIKGATMNALANLEQTGFAGNNITVANVKVIGAKRLQALSNLIGAAIQTAKRAIIPVFGIGGLLLMLLSLFV